MKINRKHGFALRTRDRLQFDLVDRSPQRWCQTNANQSLFAQTRPSSGCAKIAPLGESGGAVGLEVGSAVEGALLIEMVVN